jgi:hypothetical protein
VRIPPRRQGRIKLFGTLVFPKSKLTTIKGKPLARAGSGASYPAPHRILHDVAEASRPHGSAYVYPLPHARSDRSHAVAGRCAVDGCGIAATDVDVKRPGASVLTDLSLPWCAVGSKDKLLCDDVIETLVVFSEAHWVGTYAATTHSVQ